MDHLDHPCCQSSRRPVIGIDEVGRGSLIGDVVTAAVCFTDGLPSGLRDSKAISAKKREALNITIRQVAIWSIGRASVEEIDHYGILEATMIAMARAWQGIDENIRREAMVIVDGDKSPPIKTSMVLLPKGDSLCPTVSAASIIAKVQRDAEITELHEQEQRYGWNKNKGYGTRDHYLAIEKYGPTSFHRRSFNPVRSIIRESLKASQK